MTYRAVFDDIAGMAMVAEIENDEPVTIAHVTKTDSDFPLDKKQLLENVTAVLNGHDPLHQMPAGKDQIYYSRVDNALILSRRIGGQGVSTPGMLLTVSENSSSGDLGQAFLKKLTPDAMKKICDAVHTDSSNDPGANTDKAPPKPPSHR